MPTDISERFRALLESAPDAMLVVDETGTVSAANERARRLFGYDSDTLDGKCIELLFTRDRRGMNQAWRVEASASDSHGSDSKFEAHGVRKDGTELPLEISLNALALDGRRVVLGAIRDSTDRARSEEKFRGLVESAPDAIVIVDETGVISLVNRQAEKMFGYLRDEILGESVEILIPNRLRAAHAERRAHYFEGPSTRPMGAGIELLASRKDGREFPVEISLSPLHTEEGILVSAAIRDITERKRMQRALEEKNFEIENASRAKDRFFAAMSHELRTPLNAILGFTGTLLMRQPGPLNLEQETQLQTIRASARQLLSMINDLLDLAKVESGRVDLHLEQVICQDLVADVVQLMRPLAQEKHLELSSKVPPRPVAVETDRRAVSQILINLINNAIKFTDKGSVCVNVNELDGDSQVVFAVADTGVGIKPEDQALLFEFFRQLQSGKRRFVEGSGLGLHLSEKLAKLLGGRITVESSYGIGSTFALVLPNTGKFNASIAG